MDSSSRHLCVDRSIVGVGVKPRCSFDKSSIFGFRPIASGSGIVPSFSINAFDQCSLLLIPFQFLQNTCFRLSMSSAKSSSTLPSSSSQALHNDKRTAFPSSKCRDDCQHFGAFCAIKSRHLHVRKLLLANHGFIPKRAISISTSSDTSTLAPHHTQDM